MNMSTLSFRWLVANAKRPSCLSSRTIPAGSLVCAAKPQTSRALFTESNRQNNRILELERTMTNEQLYANLPRLKQSLPPHEFEELKERVMEPYRQRNRTVGVSLLTFIGLVFVYSMYKTKTEDISNVK